MRRTAIAAGACALAAAATVALTVPTVFAAEEATARPVALRPGDSVTVQRWQEFTVNPGGNVGVVLLHRANAPADSLLVPEVDLWRGLDLDGDESDESADGFVVLDPGTAPATDHLVRASSLGHTQVRYEESAGARALPVAFGMSAGRPVVRVVAIGAGATVAVRYATPVNPLKDRYAYGPPVFLTAPDPAGSPRISSDLDALTPTVDTGYRPAAGAVTACRQYTAPHSGGYVLVVPVVDPAATVELTAGTC